METNKPNWTRYIPYDDGDSIEDVKKTYRALVKTFHPDSSNANEDKVKN